MQMKKAAVSHVQAIHERPIAVLRPFAPRSHAPERKALGDVVAHEIDHERARNDGQRSGRSEQARARSPSCSTVRVMVAAIGLAATEVSVLASSSSTQENMKQKKAATPMPAAMVGRKMRRKKRQKP